MIKYQVITCSLNAYEAGKGGGLSFSFTRAYLSYHNLAKIDNEFPVMINDQLIPRVHSIPCLGVKLDETLNWDEHIEMVCKKVGAGIGILKRIKPYVPADTLISIYNALIQPYFDYCSPLWGVCNKTLRNNLQKFQKNNSWRQL
jgi:hypothetical protein